MTPRAQLPERSAQSVDRRTLRRPIGTLLAITVSLTLVAQA